MIFGVAIGPRNPMSSSSSEAPLHPSLRAALAEALRALPGAELVTLSNLYGLPILRLAAEPPTPPAS